MDYRDKVVIVTGGTKGIGEGCVRVFIDAGARVVFCARRQDGGDKLTAALKGLGQAFFIKCDVADTDEIKALIEQTVAKYGRIDCLINNAGWHPPDKPIDDFSIDDFRDLLNLNLVSIFAACKFALPHLRKTKGNIINMSSLVGTIGQLHATTYVASKGGITAFTKALAIDEAANGVEYHRVERASGKFSRSFYLPQTVKTDAIKATYRDGILEIHVPKADEAKPKQIAISVN